MDQHSIANAVDHRPANRRTQSPCCASRHAGTSPVRRLPAGPDAATTVSMARTNGKHAALDRGARPLVPGVGRGGIHQIHLSTCSRADGFPPIAWAARVPGVAFEAPVKPPSVALSRHSAAEPRARSRPDQPIARRRYAAHLCAASARGNDGPPPRCLAAASKLGFGTPIRFSSARRVGRHRRRQRTQGDCVLQLAVALLLGG